MKIFGFALLAFVGLVSGAIVTFFALAPVYAQHELNSPQTSMMLACVDVRHGAHRSSAQIDQCLRKHGFSGTVSVLTKEVITR